MLFAHTEQKTTTSHSHSNPTKHPKMTLTKEQVIKMLEEGKEKMKKDPAQATNQFLANAKILPNHHAAVSGKAGIEAYHKGKAACYGSMDVKHTVDDVLNEGDLAIVDGTMIITKDGKEFDNSKFMMIFKKDGDSYKILRAMHNTSKPMPAH